MATMMEAETTAKIEDATGTVWNVVIDIPDARQVVKEFGVNLLNIQGFMQWVGEDDENQFVCLDILFFLCRDQVAQRSLTAADCAKAIGVQRMQSVIDVLVDAALEALPPEKQPAARQMVNLDRRKRREVLDLAEAPETMAKLEAAIDEAYGLPSTKPQQGSD